MNKKSLTTITIIITLLLLTGTATTLLKTTNNEKKQDSANNKITETTTTETIENKQKTAQTEQQETNTQKPKQKEQTETQKISDNEELVLPDITATKGNTVEFKLPEKQETIYKVTKGPGKIRNNKYTYNTKETGEKTVQITQITENREKTTNNFTIKINDREKTETIQKEEQKTETPKTKETNTDTETTSKETEDTETEKQEKETQEINKETSQEQEKGTKETEDTEKTPEQLIEQINNEETQTENTDTNNQPTTLTTTETQNTEEPTIERIEKSIGYRRNYSWNNSVHYNNQIYRDDAYLIDNNFLINITNTLEQTIYPYVEYWPKNNTEDKKNQKIIPDNISSGEQKIAGDFYTNMDLEPGPNKHIAYFKWNDSDGNTQTKYVDTTWTVYHRPNRNRPMIKTQPNKNNYTVKPGNTANVEFPTTIETFVYPNRVTLQIKQDEDNQYKEPVYNKTHRRETRKTFTLNNIPEKYRKPGNYTYNATIHYNKTEATETKTGNYTIKEQKPANLQINHLETNEPVPEGETLETETTIENTGETQDTQTLKLKVDGETVETKEVTLKPGETTTKTLKWNTKQRDHGDKTLTITTENDSATEEIFIKDKYAIETTKDTENTVICDTDTTEFTTTAKNTEKVETKWYIAGEKVATQTKTGEGDLTFKHKQEWSCDKYAEEKVTVKAKTNTGNNTKTKTWNMKIGQLDW